MYSRYMREIYIIGPAKSEMIEQQRNVRSKVIPMLIWFLFYVSIPGLCSARINLVFLYLL